VIRPTYLLAILLLVSLAQAATVTLAPTSIYETTINWETLDINNYQGSSVITNVKVSSPSLTITDAKTYSGWTKTQDSSTAEWSSGSIETNVQSALFEFEVSAPNITADTTATLTLSLDSTNTNMNITILNDATPPNITNIIPTGYARANNPAQGVSATITDSETGVASATYSWNDCSGSSTTKILTPSNTTYSTITNFTAYDEGATACYTFTANNNAGETATATGQLLFDGTAPSVTISAPTTFATETTDFSFTATDNLATTLACTLQLDSNTLTTVNATNGTLTTVTQDLSNYTEGNRTWSVTCADGVGLTATHAQAIVLDTQAPAVTVDTSAILRTQQTTVTTTVTDTSSGVVSVSATWDGNPVNLTQNGNDYQASITSSVLGVKQLVITAIDNAGHTTTHNQNVTTVPNHQLTLTLSPSSVNPGETVTASGTLTSDGNVTSNTITINTQSQNITVNLTSNSYSTTFTAPSGGTYTITAEYTDGGFTYIVQGTLSVSTPQQQNFGGSSSSGYDSTWGGGSGYVKPSETETGGGSNAVVPDEPVQEETTPPPAPEPGNYDPIPAEEPRQALTPQATGVFGLGDTIKWVSILLALALIGGLGAYAFYNNKKKEEGGLNWDGYFK